MPSQADGSNVLMQHDKEKGKTIFFKGKDFAIVEKHYKPNEEFLFKRMGQSI